MKETFLMHYITIEISMVNPNQVISESVLASKRLEMNPSILSCAQLPVYSTCIAKLLFTAVFRVKP